MENLTMTKNTKLIKGITAGVFDLCHSGHLAMFRECKDQCDYLTVLVQVDPSQHRVGKQKPIETIWERYDRIMSSRYVDRVIPYETEEDLRNMLSILKYDKRFIGEDHKHGIFTGDYMRPDTFVWNKRTHNYSSTNLRERIVNEATFVTSDNVLLDSVGGLSDEIIKDINIQNYELKGK